MTWLVSVKSLAAPSMCSKVEIALCTTTLKGTKISQLGALPIYPEFGALLLCSAPRFPSLVHTLFTLSSEQHCSAMHRTKFNLVRILNTKHKTI